MKALVVGGGGGQLATELMQAEWSSLDGSHILTRDELDITSEESVEAAVASQAWPVVVNAAAYTAVDRAESEMKEAFRVNCDGPAHLARACAKRDVPLIHISTDYVFDGAKTEPYVEDDRAAPINVYGQSKWAGEQAVRTAHERHIILRTSWVYSAHGSNFVKSILRLASERSELSIVCDQRGSPTSAADLAAVIVQVSERIVCGEGGRWGTFHYCGAGVTTWFEFAAEILAQTGSTTRLNPITTAAFGAPAARPRNSSLNCTRIRATYGIEPRPWQVSLRTVLSELVSSK